MDLKFNSLVIRSNSTPPSPKTKLTSGKKQSSPRREKRELSVLTREELKRWFAAINSKRDTALFLLAYRHERL